MGGIPKFSIKEFSGHLQYRPEAVAKRAHAALARKCENQRECKTDVFPGFCQRQNTLKSSRKTVPASQMLRFADLVVMAGRLHPFPFRTRP
jgi:hypothetical protein